jgi:hypothetical protein
MNVNSFEMEMQADQQATDYLEITNTGDPGSVLNFDIFWQAGSPPPPAADKSVAGSNLTCNPEFYVPDYTMDLICTVHNASPDGEWLTRVTLDFPTGATVNSSTNFVGGSAGNLVTNGSTGNGVIVIWNGDTGPPDYNGVVGPGESATATVNVSYGAALSGPQVLFYTITGDEQGASPHVTSGYIILEQGSPPLTVTVPNGGERWPVGDNVDITWDTSASFTEVKIDLSRNGGGSWETLTASTDNDGSYSWMVSAPVSNLCLVRISNLDGSINDTSDAVFSIYEPVMWLTASPTEGSCPQGETEVIELSIDSSGMSDGTYYAELVVTHNAVGSPDVVPITLVVMTETGIEQEMPFFFALGGNYPNPFNPRTTIAFALPQAGEARIEVLDLQGKLVRTLQAGRLEAGPHSVQWDGCDSNQRPVAAGTYIARLRTGEHEATTKMLLAK